jgi:hypothetical protein
MKQMSVALGIVGLVWATVLPASAQKTVKLFGTTYNVTSFTRDQTYKTAAGKQVKIVLQPTMDSNGNSYDQKSSLYFSQGADPTKDRLLVMAHLSADNDGPVWHNLYMLTGAGTDGQFAPANTTLTEFFGGAGDRLSGGRPIGGMIINDTDTGVKKDRNVLLMQWTGDNGYRLYDWDTMSSKYNDSELFFDIDGALGTATEDAYVSANIVPDPNAPYGDEQGYAPLPTDDGHTILAVGVSQSGGADAGIWDTTKNLYYPVHSEISANTASDPTPIPTDHSPHAFAHVTGIEYWILMSDTIPNGAGVDATSQQIYDVQFTLPADPSKGKAEDIKAKATAKEEVFGTALASAGSDVFGMAIGRETPAGSGKHMLYFGTTDGKIVVCTPL